MFKFLKNKSSGVGKGGVEISATARSDVDGSNALIRISGNWLLGNRRTPINKVLREIPSDVEKIAFNASALGDYDSSLICLLLRCYEHASQIGAKIDIDSIPHGPRELLKLAIAVPEAEVSKSDVSHRNVLTRIGSSTIGFLDSIKSQSEFIGEIAIASAKACVGHARYRIRDLLLVIQKSGPDALPIVALISFLVGMILAFVGGIQLAKYGSEIFVADLVGIAMCREMGAIMVGIVMAGRTGASFAAELGSMKVNEEISAFRTFGLSPMEFLVFPRILALVMMFPLLTIFADIIGILGGLTIGLGLNLGCEQYLNRTYAALNITQIFTGIGKSFVFGIVVACIGCRMGLQCENSSAGVGTATTSSVVQSITWIIVIDAIFAVIFTIFDI